MPDRMECAQVAPIQNRKCVLEGQILFQVSIPRVSALVVVRLVVSIARLMVERYALFIAAVEARAPCKFLHGRIGT